MRKTLTLVELIIAAALMGVIALGAISFDYASREFLHSSEQAVRVLNNLTFILEHVHKNVLLGAGSLDRPAITGTADASGAYTLTIWQDLGPAGTALNTPGDYTDDRQVIYVFNPTTADFGTTEANSITFQINSPQLVAPVTETISQQLMTANISYAQGIVRINDLIMRLNPGEAIDPHTNPEVQVLEQSFFPLAESLS